VLLRQLLFTALCATTLFGCDSQNSDDSDPFPQEECTPPGPSGCWIEKTATPSKRQELQPAKLGTKIYVVGGMNGTSFQDMEVLSSVEVYDTVTDSWTAVTSIPNARHHIATASTGGKFYASGGMTGQFSSEWKERDYLHEYDPDTNVWTELASMPTARGEHLAVAFGGKIYFIGGRFDLGRDSNANEVYDPATDSWDTRASMPTARRSFAVAVLDSLIYVIGGRHLDGPSLSDLATVEAYSPDSDTWYSRAELPFPRGALALGVLHDKLYAIGGEYFTGQGGVYEHNQQYDPVADHWSDVESMPRPAHGTGAVTINNTIYVAGGGVQVAVFSSGFMQAFTIDP